MPLYEYQCKECGHRFELIQSFSGEDPKECPVCHGQVERLISTPARPHFKGSGFYSTDYPAKPAASAKSEAGSGSDGNSTVAAKGGSADKPAAKTENAPNSAASTSSSKSE
jgi:putative FmdB family regulatory protein